jgi:hypothetical protein
VLLAGGGVFRIINARPVKHDESRFHTDFSDRETSPVSSAFKNASFGEFQQILANSGE